MEVEWHGGFVELGGLARLRRVRAGPPALRSSGFGLIRIRKRISLSLVGPARADRHRISSRRILSESWSAHAGRRARGGEQGIGMAWVTGWIGIRPPARGG